MCFTCYFRFTGVYLLLNNEPEGNGNLNRLRNWSQCHQKLPVLDWCSIATLFAYSAGQMCLLQHFGWNTDSHLQQDWDFILWAVCLQENAREAAVTQSHSTAGLCICVTTKLRGCAKWSATRSRAEPMLPWPKLAISMMPARPRATWCELWGTPVMQWGLAEGQVMAQMLF